MVQKGNLTVAFSRQGTGEGRSPCCYNQCSPSTLLAPHSGACETFQVLLGKSDCGRDRRISVREQGGHQRER